jgi:phosphohistidine swiveling domain-containing protein
MSSLAIEVRTLEKRGPQTCEGSEPLQALDEASFLNGRSGRELGKNGTETIFGTKAETLERFKGRVKKSVIPDLFYFTVVEWKKSERMILEILRKRFDGQPLAVRSSAYSEDGAMQSLAGAFRSCLNVNSQDEEALRKAIERVISSYSGNPHDQVLVQPMVNDVSLSGVIMTHDLSSGAPYYIINYDDESGKTDVITGGTGVNKTVVVHHHSNLTFIESPRVAKLVEMTQELEHICGGRLPLDIEFAQSKNEDVYLLQVRRIAVQKNWNRAVQTRLSEALEHLEQFFIEHSHPRLGLAGSTTILGQMPDWNPAELIGTQPTPLAISLFRTLVTESVWQEARTSMGYRPVPNEPLMVILAGRPYIDVRNSFNSFLPAGLPPPIENALINGWLHRLAIHPEYHDKVEFEVAQTVLDFAFEKNFEARYSDVLGPEEHRCYTEKLGELTARNVSLAPGRSLPQSLETVQRLKKRQEDPSEKSKLPPLQRAMRLLGECREDGSLQFSIIARHAFIAETLLRSGLWRGAWSAERLAEFKRTLITVAGELGQDFARVINGNLSKGQFFRRFGHLRPGTFDILSPRYDQREDLFRDGHLMNNHDSPLSAAFVLTPQEKASFQTLLKEIRLLITPEELLAYAGQAIVNREYSKFVFTKHLSDAMEYIAEWGETIGLTRDDLSYLTLHDLEETVHTPVTRDRETHFHELAESRRTYAREMRGLRLGYIIRDVHDLYVVPLHRGSANFVTTKSIEKENALLDNRMAGQTNLFSKIVCIESADPGFDWIFTKGIAGLVTKFGGANSHMTIRCAELGIPAAIGVGEQTFERLVKASRIELRCGEKIVRPIYG